MRTRIRKYLLNLKRQQFLGRQGGYWPNMLVFWLLCTSLIVTAILIYILINFREYPFYAEFNDIQCHDAIHTNSGNGRYAHVQMFDIGGEELIIRGSFAGSSGILYVDRMAERDRIYHICFVRLQGIFLDDNSRLVGVWRQDSKSKGKVNRGEIESKINDFNNGLILAVDAIFYPICFVVCFSIVVDVFIRLVFSVGLLNYEKNKK